MSLLALLLVFSFLIFWLLWVFVAAPGLSLVAVSGGYSLLQCAGSSLPWLLLLRSTGSRHAGFSSCSTWAQQLWRTGLAAPRHVGSSRTKAQSHVPCIGRWILNHCASREVTLLLFNVTFRIIINTASQKQQLDISEDDSVQIS